MSKENTCRIRLYSGVACLLASVYILIYNIAHDNALLGADFALFIIGVVLIIKATLFWFKSNDQDHKDN